MDSVHAHLLYSQQLGTYGLVFIAVLTFLGVLVAAWAAYLTRGTRESVERATALVKAVEERLERTSHYLFVKMGPAEMK